MPSVWIHSTMFYQVGLGGSLAVATWSRVAIAAAATATPLKTSAEGTPMDYSKQKKSSSPWSIMRASHRLTYSQPGCIKNRGTMACGSTAIERLPQKKKRFQFHMDRIRSIAPNRLLVFVFDLKATLGGGDAASISPHKKSILQPQTQFAFPESFYPYKNPILQPQPLL